MPDSAAAPLQVSFEKGIELLIPRIHPAALPRGLKARAKRLLHNGLFALGIEWAPERDPYGGTFNIPAGSKAKLITSTLLPALSLPIHHLLVSVRRQALR